MNKSIDHLITKRFRNMVDKFNQDLKDFAERCEEQEPTLYEDAFIHFTLSDIRIEGDYLVYKYDGQEERDIIAYWDDEENDFYCYVEQMKEDIKFWRSCLNRAKRYWEMSCDELDKMESKILNGEIDE